MSEQFEFGERVQVYPIHNNWKPARYISRTSGCHCVLVDGEIDPSFYAECRRPVRTIRIGEREVNAPLWERPADLTQTTFRLRLGSDPQFGRASDWTLQCYLDGRVFKSLCRSLIYIGKLANSLSRCPLSSSLFCAGFGLASESD